MALEILGQVGPQVVADGVNPTFRMGRTAEVVVTELHGRYYEATFRKNLFTAYAAAVATSLAGTGMVGLQVWNGSPLTGGVNLSILKVGGMVIATSASATSLALAFGTGQVSAPSSQTAITGVRNNFIGAVGPQASAMNAGTFTNAPVSAMLLMHNTAAIAVTGEDPGFSIDLEGSFVVPPQCYVAIVAVGAAIAASGSNLHLMWEEVPG